MGLVALGVCYLTNTCQQFGEALGDVLNDGWVPPWDDIGPDPLDEDYCPPVASSGDGGGDDEDDGCDEEWEQARQLCRRMIMLQLEAEAGRGRPNREIQDVTGGSRDIEQCATGLVSYRCGGNNIHLGY